MAEQALLIILKVAWTYTDLNAITPQRAYKCARYEGHHGHLFMGGPLPTGKRWYNNRVALHFVPS